MNAPVTYEFAPGEAARVTLEWAFDGEVAYGRYIVDMPVYAGVFVNGCFAPAEVAAATPNTCRLIQQTTELQVAFAGKTEQPWTLDTRDQAEFAWAGIPVSPGKHMALYPVAITPETPLYFAMRLVNKAESSEQVCVDPENVDRLLQAGAEAFTASCMSSVGGFAGAAEAVTGLVGFSRTYDPIRACVQTTVNRTWGGPNSPGLVFGWDNFFDSYLAAWTDPALGAASLEHIVTVYGERGIENGPVQRNLIIPAMYCRTLDIIGDEALARRTWPTMMAFMRFWFADRGDGCAWRDGNGDGLIESGACKDPSRYLPGVLISDAMDETGYDELPSYSAGFTDGRRGLLANGVEFEARSRTLTLTLLCQNSLYVTSCRAMARWASRLGMTGDAEWLLAEEARMVGRIRERLYCDEDGLFHDRRWDGAFSRVNTMTIFYPLLAGLADERTKERLQAMLLDPRQFWGENLIPTVSRDDPAYCDGLDRQGNYWRGNCWPPTTYIVYLAIKEAGWDDIAAEFARRVYAQFMEYWLQHGHAYENYPPEGKVDHRFLYLGGWGGRELRYVWAGMMPLCALEEVFAPEVMQPGVRFGNPFLARETSWSGFTFGGERIQATAGPARTEVRCGTQWHFLAEPGVAVRAFVRDKGEFSFLAQSSMPVKIRFTAPDLSECYTVEVNGEVGSATWEDATLCLSLPDGKHHVRILAHAGVGVKS